MVKDCGGCTWWKTINGIAGECTNEQSSLFGELTDDHSCDLWEPRGHDEDEELVYGDELPGEIHGRFGK